MIVEHESSDSEIDDFLKHNTLNGGDGTLAPSLTPTHVSRFKPLVISDSESSEDDGEGEHNQLPVVRKGATNVHVCI